MGIGIVELLLLLVVAAGVVLGVVALVVVLVLQPGRRVESTREWRLVQLTRLVGLALGIAVALAVAERGSWGVGPMLAPSAFGLVLLLAAALGETVVRPRGTPGPRTASLRPRRVADYLPPVLGPVVGLVVVALALTLLLTTLTASRDGYTGEVRALSCSGPNNAQTHTPYPGSFYSLPLALLLVAVLAVAAVAARQVVRRPRGLGGTDADDDALRRRSLAVVVAATGLAVAAPYVGIALVAGGALRSMTGGQPSCAAGWMGPVGLVLMVSALPAVAVAATCLVQLLVGGPLLRAADAPPLEARR